MSNNEDTYEKPRVFRDRTKRRRGEVPEYEREHPLHQPYRRDNNGNLRHSLMIDGLGEEDENP